MTLVDGLISDCGRIVAERKDAEGWFDMSTLKEPYRVEGKKTMGYEVAEQFGWELPDAIFYPTGGGVGLIGMWKAFEEMEQLGWISGRTAEDDRGAGRRLPAGGARVRTWRVAEPSSGKTPRPSPPGCACPSRWATSWCWTRFAPAAARRSRSRIRKSWMPDRTGAARRHFRGSGRRGLHRRSAQAAQIRIPDAGRANRHLQHRFRPEISGSIFHAISAAGCFRARQTGRPHYTALDSGPPIFDTVP